MLVIMLIVLQIIFNLVCEYFITKKYGHLVFSFLYLETLYIRRRSQLLRDNRPFEVNHIYLHIDIYK